MNSNLDVIWVCPLSSSIHKFEGNPILKPNSENGLKVESEIMVFHIRSISKKRFKMKIGSISTEQMNQISVTINDIIEL